MKTTIKLMQGDVQGTSILILPKNAVKIKNTPLALGEKSGHQHVLTGDVEMYEFEGNKFAVVGHEGTMLQHVHISNITEADLKSTKELKMADHKPHLLPEGIYAFHIQNSYNPYSKIMEKVLD